MGIVVAEWCVETSLKGSAFQQLSTQTLINPRGLSFLSACYNSI